MSLVYVCGVVEVPTLIHQHDIKKLMSCLTNYEVIEEMYGLQKSVISIDPEYWKNSQNWLKLNMEDTPNEGDLNAPTANEVIKGITFGANAINSNQILLVHCQMGISRSPAMAIGSLVKANRDIAGAFDQVLAVRPRIDPNPLIIKLIDEHLKLNGELITYNENFRKDFRASLRKSYLEMVEIYLNDSKALGIIFENVNQLSKI